MDTLAYNFGKVRAHRCDPVSLPTPRRVVPKHARTSPNCPCIHRHSFRFGDGERPRRREVVVWTTIPLNVTNVKATNLSDTSPGYGLIAHTITSDKPSWCKGGTLTGPTAKLDESWSVASPPLVVAVHPNTSVSAPLVTIDVPPGATTVLTPSSSSPEVDR